MYIKILQGNDTAIYECDKVLTKTLIDGQGKSVLLTIMNGKEEQIEIEIKSGSQVFVMNNEGKTIDRYR